MLRTLPLAARADARLTLLTRLASIALFTLLTALGARVTVEIGPVPLTLQTLAVFLAGMVLGARDGAYSQILYVGLIALNLPLDANAVGSAVFLGPTWGYLVGFIPCAYVAGLLVERAGDRVWQRVAAGLIGSAFVFALGFVVLKFTLGLDWSTAFTTGVIEFMPENFAKALIAGGLTEGARVALLRLLSPGNHLG
jgi:biotin transport system substrate-specific component